MDSNEILNYVKEGMRLAAIGSIAHIGIMYAVQSLSKFPFQKTIDSDDELEKIVYEESKKLGIDAKKITIKESTQIGVEKNGDKYDFFIDKNSLWCTRGIVKHELYHISSGDCDKFEGKNTRQVLSNPYYWFIAEPRATLYQTFGIKI